MDYEPLLDPENKYALAYNRYKEDVNSYLNSFRNEIDDPLNEWEIDEWIESELESLREIFTKEFNALTDKKKYFFGWFQSRCCLDHRFNSIAQIIWCKWWRRKFFR